MRFRIDLKIFILLILFYLTKQIHIYACLMLFAMMHELGHLLSGLLLGMKPEKIEIKPFGFSISFKLTPDDYNKRIKKGNQLVIKKILVALAGPLTNLIIILIVIYTQNELWKSLIIIYTNILIFLFNMLPIYPLDGGRILNGILHIYFGKQKADKYSNRISFVITIILTIVGSISILYLKNIAIFFGVIYLWILFLKEDNIEKARTRMYDILNQERNTIKKIKINY